MAISTKTRRLFSRLQPLFFNPLRLNHTLIRDKDKSLLEVPEYVSKLSFYDTSKWKVVNSRALGIDFRKISPSSLLILSILRQKGFQAYLVGGCVRDLLLDKIPKDFDVITNAKLMEIEEHFKRVWVVGTEFPICQVFVKGSMVEVSSFETVARHSQDKERVSFSQRPTGCDESDFVRWRNCLDRDFTINSLFYDPSINKIYDYANGMEDLKLCRVQTVIPAQLSFQEDCARILRGIRIASRLGLSFSEETTTAIHQLYLSVGGLPKARLIREINFMFSYGAAAPSLYLLKEFKILDFLLPAHAAYLAEQAHKQTFPIMLFELFISMDKLLGCDRPSENSLWLALLAFHLALANNPQDALVIWAFSSVLHNGNWEAAVTFARKKAHMRIGFSPEILEVCGTKSDEALAEDVTRFACLVKSAAEAMTESEGLDQLMAKYPNFPYSGLVFISKMMGRKVTNLYDVIQRDVTLCRRKWEKLWIDYKSLGKGELIETRIVLGKVLLDTMMRGVVPEQRQEVMQGSNVQTLEVDKICHKSQHQQEIRLRPIKQSRGREKYRTKSNVNQQQKADKTQLQKENKLGPREMIGKHQKSQYEQVVTDEESQHSDFNPEKRQHVNDEHRKLHQQVVKKKQTNLSDSNRETKQLENNKHYNLHQQVTKNEKCHGHPPGSDPVQQEEVEIKREKQRQKVSKGSYRKPDSNLEDQQVVSEKCSRPLSSLFM